MLTGISAQIWLCGVFCQLKVVVPSCRWVSANQVLGSDEENFRCFGVETGFFQTGAVSMGVPGRDIPKVGH